MKLAAIILFFEISAHAALRIVTTSPALTELMFQLGCGGNVIGVSEFSDVPEAAKALPRIGSLFHPSIEKTILLRPELILLDHYTMNNSYAQAVRALKIPMHTIRIDSVENLFKVSQSLLESICPESSKVLTPLGVLYMDLKGRAQPFRFLVLTWVEPAIVASRKTFLSSLFETIGGENLVPKTVVAPYLPVSREWLLMQSPDFVFVLHGGKVEGLKRTTKILPLSPDSFARTNFSGLLSLRGLREEMWK